MMREGGDVTASVKQDVAGQADGPQSTPRTVLFSAVKNEAPFLLEWVAYHKAIGFDEIVICSNPSTDGTEDILAALAVAGQITHLRTTPAPNQSPQSAAVQAFEKQGGCRDGQWYLWLDADEFLNIHVGDRTIGALVSALGLRRGIILNWRIFGSNGHATFPGRFISAAFGMASAEGRVANLEVKTLFKFGSGVRGFAPRFNHRPLLDGKNPLTLDDFLTGNGKPPLADYSRNLNWLAGEDFASTHMVEATEAGWALAQINHYAVRTPDFFALKRSRGRSVVAAASGAHSRYNDSFFKRYDRNESHDASILAWADRVTTKMEALVASPQVAAAIAASRPLIAADLAASAATVLEAPSTLRPQVAEPLHGTMNATMQVASLDVTRTLPEAEAQLVREHYTASASILEYGSGWTTGLAADLGKPVVAVESDKEWAALLAESMLGHQGQVRIHHVDIGRTKAWGYPVGTDGAARFHTYALSVWDLPDFSHPDVVLIDGRFRAACFAATMLRITRPVTVLFDDYAPRKNYHRVENLAKCEAVVGRMARFTVTPQPIPPEMLTEVIGWFCDPR
jgi:Glycosyl transferase family 2